MHVYRCNYIEQSQRHTTNDIHMHTQYLKLLLYRRVCKMFTRLKIIFSWLLVEDELLEYQRTNGKIFGKTAAMAFKYCQTFSITSASLTVGHRCTKSSSSCIKNQPKSQHTMQMARKLHTYRSDEMLPDMRSTFNYSTCLAFASTQLFQATPFVNRIVTVPFIIYKPV